MFFVYILFSKSINKYYIGSTKDPIKRLIDHNSTYHKTKFTRKNALDWQIVYTELFTSRSLAILREKQIKKKKNRKYIEELIRDQ